MYVYSTYNIGEKRLPGLLAFHMLIYHSYLYSFSVRATVAQCKMENKGNSIYETQKCDSVLLAVSYYIL